jgi:hypothetical protein
VQRRKSIRHIRSWISVLDLNAREVYLHTRNASGGNLVKVDTGELGGSEKPIKICYLRLADRRDITVWCKRSEYPLNIARYVIGGPSFSRNSICRTRLNKWGRVFRPFAPHCNWWGLRYLLAGSYFQSLQVRPGQPLDPVRLAGKIGQRSGWLLACQQSGSHWGRFRCGGRKSHRGAPPLVEITG